MTRKDLRILPMFCAALATMTVTAPLACDVPPGAAVSAFDAKRMSKFDISRDQGLTEAMQAGTAADRAIVAELFAGEQAVRTLPDGRYRCRTIKLGGLLPLVIYDYFDCTISQDGTKIDKKTGSQRFTGTLTPSGDSLFYVGAQHYGDEQPMAYGADEDRDQVGCLSAIAGDETRYRLEMPAPRRESTHDVIELVLR